MGTKFTDLSTITSSAITDTFVFAVATTTETDQLSLNELQKSFTGLTARTTNGIKIVGKTKPSGLFVSDNGLVGVDNNSPTVALEVGDSYFSTDVAQVRVTAGATSRQASYSLKDANVLWKFTKKASDTDFYIEASQDGGTTSTGVFNIDVSGNVGIFNGSTALSNKFYVSGGTIKFESGVSGFLFDPSTAEIKTSSANDIFYINKTNNDDVVLGNNVLYVDNNTSVPFIGINNITPAYPLDIKGSGQLARYKNNTTATTSLSFENTARTGYVGIYNSNFQIGPTNSLSINNLVYDLANRKLGLGTTTPVAKIHAVSATPESSIFECSGTNNCKSTILNSYASGPVQTAFQSFATGTASSEITKWSIGLYNNSSLSFDSVFAFSLEGSLSSSAIKAYLNKDGDFDLKGGITTSGNYTKGKFVQVFKTRLTGNNIYFDPFSESSSASPSGHNSVLCPFGITAYAGRIEKIQIISSDNLTAYADARFEIAAVTPVTNTPVGVIDQTTFLPCSTSSTISGAIGYLDIAAITRNQLLTLNRTQFTNTTAFASGQLLQYRICQWEGGANPGQTTAKNFTVMSTVSFTVT